MTEPIPPSSSKSVMPEPLGKGRTPPKRALRERSPILAHLRAKLLTGLVAAIPLFITCWVLSLAYGVVTAVTKAPADWIVDGLTGFMPDPNKAATLKTVLPPVLAVFISVVVVYLVGLLSTFFIGRQIIARVEHFIQNLPLIKGIYGTTKQVIGVFRQGGEDHGFQRVILVEFPRVGTWTIGFVTKTVHDPVTDKKLVCCFIPMTPNPTSGFFQMFPEESVRNTDWTVDMGIKIVLSGGLLAPGDLPGRQAK